MSLMYVKEADGSLFDNQILLKIKYFMYNISYNKNR